MSWQGACKHTPTSIGKTPAMPHYGTGDRIDPRLLMEKTPVCPIVGPRHTAASPPAGTDLLTLFALGRASISPRPSARNSGIPMAHCMLTRIIGFVSRHGSCFSLQLHEFIYLRKINPFFHKNVLTADLIIITSGLTRLRVAFA